MLWKYLQWPLPRSQRNSRRIRRLPGLRRTVNARSKVSPHWRLHRRLKHPRPAFRGTSRRSVGDQVYGSVTPTSLATVAVLDTGVDASHPDLTDNVVAGHTFTD